MRSQRAEKKKALEEEREKVLDTASDMLWNTQRAGFEMGVCVVYDNYPQLKESGINVLDLVSSAEAPIAQAPPSSAVPPTNDEEHVFGEILSGAPVKGCEDVRGDDPPAQG